MDKLQKVQYGIVTQNDFDSLLHFKSWFVVQLHILTEIEAHETLDNILNVGTA